jgi:hypothetical protein
MKSHGHLRSDDRTAPTGAAKAVLVAAMPEPVLEYESLSRA